MCGLENIVLDLITEYADDFWRRQRRRWEHGEADGVYFLNENDCLQQVITHALGGART